MTEGCVKRKVKTPYGTVLAHIDSGKNLVFLNRHGSSKNTPPHRINHKANITALRLCGAGEVVGVCSVGSLKKNSKPGSVLIPDDYVSLWSIPTFFNKKVKHITPALSEKLREKIINAAAQSHLPVIKKGVYVQTTGPRLETKAEIRFLSRIADVVGMTMASEATLAQEAGLEYAGVCFVDNYAHGVVKERLDFEDVISKAAKDRNRLLMQKLLAAGLRPA